MLQNDDPRVAETAVVGYSHDVFGQGRACQHTHQLSLLALHHPPSAPPAIYAYIILKNDCPDLDKDVMKDLCQLVRNKIGPIAVPQKFLVLAHSRQGWHVEHL